MSRSKTLLELVQDRAFRPSRHFDLLFTDGSIADLLNEVIAGHVELPRGEYVRLSWIEYWAEGVHTGKADRGIAMLNLVNAIRGAHPVYAGPSRGAGTRDRPPDRRRAARDAGRVPLAR